VKQEEELLNANKQEFLRHYKQLKTTNSASVVINENVKKNQDILNRLLRQGLIDKDGNVV
jgi:hypothetical protein